jgi:hypothetical protein
VCVRAFVFAQIYPESHLSFALLGRINRMAGAAVIIFIICPLGSNHRCRWKCLFSEGYLTCSLPGTYVNAIGGVWDGGSLIKCLTASYTIPTNETANHDPRQVTPVQPLNTTSGPWRLPGITLTRTWSWRTYMVPILPTCVDCAYIFRPAHTPTKGVYSRLLRPCIRRPVTASYPAAASTACSTHNKYFAPVPCEQRRRRSMSARSSTSRKRCD